MHFYETSAKDNINVKQVFDKLVEIICDKMTDSIDSSVAGANAGGASAFGTQNAASGTRKLNMNQQAADTMKQAASQCQQC